MKQETGLLETAAQALRDHGLAAALTALIGGALGLAAAVTRRAFTNEALLARLDAELADERKRVEHERARDREADAERLARIEDDIRAMRRLMFEALQHRGDGRDGA